MREPAAELAALQELIERSVNRAGPHMRGLIHPGKYTLSAAQVVRLLDGMKTIAVAAPAPNGDPLVGAMDGWFLHGKFFFSSAGDAVRIRGLRKRPSVSVVRFDGDAYAITAHGKATLMFERDPEVIEIDAIFRGHYGGSAFEWSDEGVYVRVDADRFYTYSRQPERFAS